MIPTPPIIRDSIVYELGGYENGEKLIKLVLNLEKYRATQGCLCTIIVNKKELNDSQQLNDALYDFYQTIFKEKLSFSEECRQKFLDKVSLYMKLFPFPCPRLVKII